MLSIIIPVYNEESQIKRLLDTLMENSAGWPTEILIVDGGSTDHTVQRCEEAGVQVVFSPNKGRAQQMNYGASLAKGEILYFLHADTIPPSTFRSDIEEARQQGFHSGCYRLQFDSGHPVLQFYAWFTRLDLNVFRFGDQSLFVTKELFETIRGFDTDLLVMEDQEIISRLKRKGKFTILPEEVCTSARKYEQVGVFKLQLIFSLIVLLYYTGVNQTVIAHFYRQVLKG